MKRNEIIKRITAGLLALLLLATAVSCSTGSPSDPSSVVISGDIYVNEFMAINSSTLAAADGKYYDWMEIYNGTDSDVDLEGYTLSDDETKPGKWTFPSVTVAAGGYLVVYASGNSGLVNGEAHTNFSLSGSGETIVFSAPSGKVLTKIVFGKQTSDISVGVAALEDGKKLVKFGTATPGAENSKDYFVEGDITEGATFDLAINEITARDSYSLYTHDGTYSQWVEIINHSDKTVKASDYFLSDDADSPLKYRLPDVDLKAGELLVIFIDGTGYFDADSGEYHTNFSVGADEKAVYLNYRNGAEADSAELSPDMRKNNSYGRSISDFEKWVYYARPTPGSANTTTEFESLTGAASLNSEALVISEVQSANRTGIKITNKSYISTYKRAYEFQRAYDWVELYNNGSEPVKLSDYRLGTEGMSANDYSALPSYTVQPGEYKIVFMSLEEDYYVKSSGEIGCSVNLGAENDCLYLASNDGTVVDYMDTGRQFDHISVGRCDLSVPTAVYFTEPTPGKKNASSGSAEVTAQPTFSVDGGTVEAGTVITVSGPKNCKIYYTTDGSFPNIDSKLYKDGITVNETTVIRAVALQDGKICSVDTTRTFFVGYGHDLPVLSISADPDFFFAEDGGLFGYLYPRDDSLTHGNYMSKLSGKGLRERKYATHVEYYLGGNMEIDFAAEMGLFGNYSLVTDQKSLKIELKGKYGIDEINYPLIPGNDINIYNGFCLRTGGYPDTSRTRLMDLSFAKLVKTSLDLDVMDGYPVVVYINGEYWGMYNIRERLDAHYLENRYGLDPDTTDILKGNWTQLHGTSKSYRELKAYIESHDLSKKEYYDYVCSQVDIESLINWWCVECFLVNTDSGNIKYYRDNASGKWRWLLFDLDWSLFGSNYKDDHYDMIKRFCFDPNGHGVGNGFETWLMCGLYKNAEFRDLFIHRFAYVVEVTFEEERCNAMIDMLASLMESEMPNHIARWKDAGNTFTCTPSTMTKWENQISSLKFRIQDRKSYAKQQLKDFFKLTNAEMEHYFSVDEYDNPLPKLDIYGNKL